jgi:hypothetical protein
MKLRECSKEEYDLSEGDECCAIPIGILGFVKVIDGLAAFPPIVMTARRYCVECGMDYHRNGGKCGNPSACVQRYERID